MGHDLSKIEQQIQKRGVPARVFRSELKVQGGYSSPDRIPGVVFLFEDQEREFSIETAYALANALYIGADYAETDGFVIHIFTEMAKRLGNPPPDMATMGGMVARIRETRNWPPPLFDKRMIVGYGYGQNTGIPFVFFEIEARNFQISAEAARGLADGIIRAAESARNDVSVVRFLAHEMNIAMELEAEMQILSMFAAYREETHKAQREDDRTRNRGGGGWRDVQGG